MLVIKRDVTADQLLKLGFKKITLFGVANKVAYRKGTLYVAAWKGGNKKLYYSYVDDELDDLYELIKLEYVEQIKGDKDGKD